MAIEWREREGHSVEGWRGDLYLGVAIAGRSGSWIVQPCGGYAEVVPSLDDAKRVLSQAR